MRLLIITQALDLDHPVLGFFHRWVEEFARHTDHVTVIAQQVGRTTLPGNVTVFSLKKEQGSSRFRQIARFKRLIIEHRHTYDTVFVHMTPIWVVLGWPAWALLRRPVYLWYEVRRGGHVLKAAETVVRAIFSATAAGLPWPSAKQQIVGHGIDTAQFAPDGAIDRTLVTAVGRLTPVKHFPQIIEAFSTLPPQMRLRIVGDAFTVADQAEKRNILALAKQRGVSDRIEIGFLPHHELPALLARSVLSLHACAGGLDKALLEAMAAGCPVVSTSQAGTLVLPPLCQATPETFAAKALAVLDLSDDARLALGEELRAIVVKDHSLGRLIRRLVEAMALTPGASRLR